MIADEKDDSLDNELARLASLVRRALDRGRREGWVPPDTVSGSNADGGKDPCLPSLHSSLDALRRCLGLTTSEINALSLVIGYDLDPRLREVFRHLSCVNTAVTIGALLTIVYPDRSGCGLVELSPYGPLFRWKLLELDVAETFAPVSQRRVRVVPRVLEWITGEQRLDTELDCIATVDEIDHLMFSELVVDEQVRASLRNALETEHAGLLLLKGQHGSGRRSLLAAALRVLGKRALTIDARAISGDPENARRQLRIIRREARLLDLVPLFRDLEALAGGAETPDRLHLLETELDGLVLGTLTTALARRWRTPPIIIDVPPLSSAQCEALWIRAVPAASDGDAELLANIYPLAPALIVAAGEAASRHCAAQQMRPEHIEAGIRTVLDDRLAGLATRIAVRQSWEDLILPEDQTLAIVELLARVRERRRVLEDWGFADKIGRALGTVALFSGPPGTGKTMTAGLIARTLRTELYQVDLSKIVSKWIGETEKNLAMLFDAAEAGHAVLLFDEADALFSKRTEVRSSNDRYANQEVNFLLQRVESYAGICILTTNHATVLDEAFRRRLSVHIRFTMPEVDERQRLWRALIPPRAPTSGDLQLRGLAERFVMSGGYIKNAVLRAAFLAADEDAAIDAARLALAAQLEYEAMGKVVRSHGS